MTHDDRSTQIQLVYKTLNIPHIGFYMITVSAGGTQPMTGTVKSCDTKARRQFVKNCPPILD